MNGPTPTIPVVLFAYARPVHLGRVLECLRSEGVSLIYAFADGARSGVDLSGVAAVRTMLKRIDWAEVYLTERTTNLGLGRNVVAGVSEVAAQYDSFIVWEDDLVCVPGTYAWMCAALDYYAREERVMSVSAWTHPRVTPAQVGSSPYCDKRAECWVWGSWSRSWSGMESETAWDKLRAARSRGIAPDSYGSDLPAMARAETRKNIWAVRWLYHHFQHGGLCVRPPWSMVEHIGFDAQATHASGAVEWANPPLRSAPPIPPAWPPPQEHPDCRRLWRAANPGRPIHESIRRRASGMITRAKKAGKQAVPEPLRWFLRGVFGWRWFEGDYADWSEAKAKCRGYGTTEIVERVLASTMAVKEGRAAFERDGALFAQYQPEPGLSKALEAVANERGGLGQVLDFGGSLGTTYWRHRAEWVRLGLQHWDVVEQPGFVRAGAQVADERLAFFASIEDAERARAHDVLVASTVLQYVEDPAGEVARWIERGFRWIVLNNLPLHGGRPDRIAVQRVPSEMGGASYPVRFFNREKFLVPFEEHYEVVQRFPSEAVWLVGFRRYPSTGLLLKRKVKQ